MMQSRYNLRVIPDPAIIPEHCGCTTAEILAQMVQKMAAGDVVIAAQVVKLASGATAFITWNLKHFRGNLVIPVLTPDEWFQQQNPPAGSNPPTAQTPPAGPTP